MTILMIGLKDYDAAMGDRILDQDARTLIAAVDGMFARLKRDADERDAETRRWIEAGERDLSARRPRPGR